MFVVCCSLFLSLLSFVCRALSAFVVLCLLFLLASRSEHAHSTPSATEGFPGSPKISLTRDGRLGSDGRLQGSPQFRAGGSTECRPIGGAPGCPCFQRIAAYNGTMAETAPVTQVLQAIGRSEEGASEKLLPLVYAELRRLAGARMSHEMAGQTLQPT